MATFFVQTDKDYYFSGDTINGNIFINVGTFITGASGISMKFSGYECVKWVEAQQLHRPQPHNDPNRPQPVDPIALIPPNQIYNSDAPIAVSEPESEDDKQFDHRPKYIRNSRDQHFKMSYFETRNMFTKNKVMIHQCTGFQPGQYSFPFSFKTFGGWPASFRHDTQRKKGIIIYQMTVAIQPMTPTFQMKFTRQITLRQTRMVKSQTKTSAGNITSCCCINKGISSADLHFEKDGYMPGQLVQMVIQVDNSQCQANINWINVSITNAVTMRSQGHSTSDINHVYGKQLNGVPARLAYKDAQAIKESFVLKSASQLKPTCSGKLLSSTYNLNISMTHDISCKCCSDHIGGGIPVIIFPYQAPIITPVMFQTNWTPQLMPMTNMTLQNNFNNFNLASMGGGQQYPPQQPIMQQQQPMMPPQQQQMQQQQTPMMPPQQNNNMGMNNGMNNNGMNNNGMNNNGMNNNGMNNGMNNGNMGMNNNGMNNGMNNGNMGYNNNNMNNNNGMGNQNFQMTQMQMNNGYGNNGGY